MAIKRALVSVSNKSDLTEFVKRLEGAGVEIVSTGGTAKMIRDAGVPVDDIQAVTGWPEMLHGRVKTLHPAVHGGILARRSSPEHMNSLREHNIDPIDLVVVNLYPFIEVTQHSGVNLTDAIEQIDIGGVALLRAAAKNFAAVTAICDPADYAIVAEEIEAHGETTPETRKRLAAKVFQHTSTYDAAIANFLNGHDCDDEELEELPSELTISVPRSQVLRYGENPHQRAAFYRDPADDETSIASARQLHGKELSYNNILDAEGALEAVRDFTDLASAAAVVVKHGNPCGIAVGESGLDAYDAARATDPESAFGGIIAMSVEVDVHLAKRIAETFNEVVIAPSYDDEALAVLTKKKNLRLLATGKFTPKRQKLLPRGIVGGLLLMDRDLGTVKHRDLRVVTDATPTDEDLDGLLFAWRCVKWVKSNAIVFASRTATIGIGAGQMSRVDSARFAALKAHAPLDDSYLASDAFFPFRDSIDSAAAQGVRAIIQPGGSIRDEEVIAACNEHGIPMVFTGMRHFRH